MKKKLVLAMVLFVLSNCLTAQCNLYFDGRLIKSGSETACRNEYENRVREYRVELEVRNQESWDRAQNKVWDDMNNMAPDLMQGVAPPERFNGLSKAEITNKVNAYIERFSLECQQENYHSGPTVQNSSRTKRVANNPRAGELIIRSSSMDDYYRRKQRNAEIAERRRIAYEKMMAEKMAKAEKDAEERSTRATAPAYEAINEWKTGGAGDVAMRQKAAAERASRQIGFGVSGEEKSYKVTFSDEEMKTIVKQYVGTKLKDNRYNFVEHIRACFENKAGISLNTALVITPSNKKKNMEIINSYNEYCDRFTKKIINEACDELYDDWGVGFCEDNILYDMALLSDDVYSDWMTTPPGWKRIDYFGNKNHGYGENGFYAALYENTLNKGVYCLAYRGTEKNFEDIFITDIGQGLGEIFTSSKLTVSQHKQAVSLVNAITIHYSDKGNIYITGHSLGGGLASIAGLEHPECETYTFNASGVIMPTIKKYVTNKSSNAKNIKAYSTKGDPLTNIQKTGKGIINIWGIDVVVTKSFAETIVNCGEKLYKIEKMAPFLDINDMKVLEQMIKDPKQIEVLQKIDYDFIPPSLGNHYEIPNSANMGHSIAPIVELYDKSKNGSCISCKRKSIEQNRNNLNRFVSDPNNIKHCKVQM